MKTAFKGTDENLKCRDITFEVGKSYYIDNDNSVKELPQNSVVINSEVKLCTKTAIHYCDKLEDTFQYYPNNGKNRFFEIEVIGVFEDGSDKKSGTKCIKFIREITKEELEKVEEEKARIKLDSAMQIKTVQSLQEVNAHLIVGGSIALYIQGVRLGRFNGGVGDFDFILPFYQKLLTKDSIIVNDDDGEERFSGSDYDECVLINGLKADIRIDPKQRYELVKYNDFEFKVVPLWTILEAKARYAHTKGGQKHRDGIKEMLTKDK